MTPPLNRGTPPLSDGTDDNILELRPEETRRSAVQIRTTPPDILNVLVQLENDGKSRYTIRGVEKNLRLMSKFADLKQPEQAKQYLANKQCSNAYKHLICTYYNLYCKYYKIEWKKPRYRQENRAIQIPLTAKVEILVNSAKSPLCIKLNISAKTGLRPKELYTLQVKHVDLDKKQIYPATAKGGSERILNIDNTLRDQIAAYIEEHHLQLNDQLFKGNPENYSKVFRAYRNRLSQKLHDPSIQQIRLYDLRHYFCSMLYAKTGIIVYVSRQMGHKHIDTTMRYTHLVPLSDDYTSEIATNAQEAKKLIDNGFEYVDKFNENEHLYRKRKLIF